MKSITLFFIFWAILASYAFSQTNTILTSAEANMPGDSVMSVELLASLNSFWGYRDSASKLNFYIDSNNFLETSVLLDEMKGIEKNDSFGNSDFYKTYLTNIVVLPNQKYILQLTNIGIKNAQPLFHAFFSLMAKRTGNKFLFYSPLRENTTSWKTYKSGKITFHHKGSSNQSKLDAYSRQSALYDYKLKAANQSTEIFLCDNFPEALQISGINYKSDYSGYAFNTLSAKTRNKTLIVTGLENFNDFDPHDLWHDRLHNMYPASIINKPVDEGCAYLYGGSWGISWKQILKTFKQKVASDPNADWGALYQRFYNFGESKEKHLIATYVINALIVQKIEKEKGFSSVLDLLKCGKYEKGNANYFIVLERLTGINKSNLNEQVWKLIKAS